MSNPRRAKTPSAVAGLPVPVPSPADVAQPGKSSPPPQVNRTVRINVLVPSKVHRRLREISLDRDISLSQMFMAGLDLYLAKLGEPTAAELAGEKR